MTTDENNVTSELEDKQKILLKNIVNGNDNNKVNVVENEEEEETINLLTKNDKTIDEDKKEQIELQTTNFMPALPANSIQKLYQQAAAEHGGEETTNFLRNELSSMAITQQTPLQIQQQEEKQQQRLRSASSTLDANISRNPSHISKHEKKIGHRRIDEGGEVTYKRIQSKQIMGSIQLGIEQTVGRLASKPKRDLLMKDFCEMETISFPPDGSSITPAHHYSDFKFKVYAPIAFRYFRDLFGIAPCDFLMSMCAAPLFELSNPGASGSLFYLTHDDEFIIKTVQKKEGEFLQKLLPGYYMNLSQNPRTLLPKFFGLYCFNYNTKNVRLIAMNNLLPSEVKMHAKYDLKGSTFGRKASKVERQKASPTFKDLDFMDHHPNGIFLETDTYNALIKTIQRDCMVLESFQIMDYSLLMGIHNVDLAAKEKREERIKNARAKLQRNEDSEQVTAINETLNDKMNAHNTAAAVAAITASASAIGIAASSSGLSNNTGGGVGGTSLNRTRSMNRHRLVAHSTAMESITANSSMPLDEDEDVPAGGIPARSENDERLILFIGIIDILQSYRLEKKLEHTFKSIIYNGDTVSVCRPSFYAQRFQTFMSKTVFKKTPTFPLKHSPSKRKTSMVSGIVHSSRNTPIQRINAQNVRTPVPTGSSTPPPAFDDISEEDLTATSSTGYNNHNSSNTATLSHRQVYVQRSYVSSSNRSMTGDDYSDDDIASSSSVRSPVYKRSSSHLSRTSIDVTAIGCEQHINDANILKSQETNQQIIVISNNTVKLQQKKDIDADGVDADYDNNDEENNKPQVISTTKTTLIKPVKSQTYTSTLVMNDVQR